jgi:hypothetical protein
MKKIIATLLVLSSLFISTANALVFLQQPRSYGNIAMDLTALPTNIVGVNFTPEQYAATKEIMKKNCEETGLNCDSPVLADQQEEASQEGK